MDIKVKIFADGCDKEGILELNRNPIISGFTTNPTLMKKAGITDYVHFAKDLLSNIKDKPISFEVFADEFKEMQRQALMISSWADNVYVKIPITNTKGQSSYELIELLSKQNVKINVTAMTTFEQVKGIVPALSGGPGAFVSVFAGRTADAGIDPLEIMVPAVEFLKDYKNIELIWASPRELFNIVQASKIGCHIITVTHDILKKLNIIGKDLDEYSLETVRMFYNDAKSAGYVL